MNVRTPSRVACVSLMPLKEAGGVSNSLFAFFEANLTGLSKLDLIKRSDCYIDLSMANDILPDLIREKIFPKKYT